jgi:hypothetical protein
MMRDRMAQFPDSLCAWNRSAYDSYGRACLTEHILLTLTEENRTAGYPFLTQSGTQLLANIGRILAIPGGMVFTFLHTSECQAELRRRLDRGIAMLEEHTVPAEPRPPIETPIPPDEPSDEPLDPSEMPIEEALVLA